MMRKRSYILLLVAFGLVFSACGSKDSTKNATQDTDAEAVSDAQSESQSKLPAPPGEPGPVLIRLPERFPTQIFASAASEGWIALAMQSDARDVSLCPETELPVCFLGVGAIAQRLNPNQPKIVKLYESDTQSGSRIDGVAAVGSKFVFALNEGRYIGDKSTVKLVIVGENAAVERDITLSASDVQISQVALKSLDEEGLLVCKAVEPMQGKPGIICEKYDEDMQKATPFATIQAEAPVRSFDMAILDDRALVVWSESGHDYAAFLDEPTKKADLGLATAFKPQIASGLNDFAVVWQGDDAQTHVDRIPKNGSLDELNRRSLLLNGLDYRMIGGIVAVSEGYLFTFRHQNTQQVALVSTDFKSWHLLENSNSWRMMSDYASLDIQDAHTGKIIWQTAESLIGIQ